MEKHAAQEWPALTTNVWLRVNFPEPMSAVTGPCRSLTEKLSPPPTWWLDKANNGTDFQYTFKLDANKTPPTVDMTILSAANAKDKEEVGRILLGIYALDGDHLRLCVAPRERPTAFETKGKPDTVLLVLKREKK